jgi:transcription initiation factor TFIID subunit 8
MSTVYLHFLDTVRSSMIMSSRTTPTPHDFVIALRQFEISPSDLEAHLSLPPLPSITQPLIPIDSASDVQPAKLDTVLGPDLIISSSSTEEPRTLQAEAMQQRFSRIVPKHFPELPSLHTWQSTPVWASDRGAKLDQAQADARKVREQATKEGVMAEQALRRLLTASKKGKKEDDGMDGMSITAAKKSKVEEAWERARDAILEMDREAREQAEADDAAAIAEVDDADPVLDVLTDALSSQAQPSLRKARRMVVEEENLEDVDEELTMVVNCDRKYWREAARGRQ